MFLLNRNFTLCLFFTLSIFDNWAKEPVNDALVGKISILFASDMNEISSDKKGGYASVAYMLKQKREQATPLFFFFGGGSIGPSMLSSFDRGSHIIDLLNSIEPDVMAITKRDFSFFEDELSLRSYEAAFPFVASTIIETETNQPLNGLFKSVITQQGNYTIGVLSALPPNAIEEYNLHRIEIINITKAIKAESEKLRRENVDLIVLITSGLENDALALLNDNTVDLVLQKDSHASEFYNRRIPDNPQYIFIQNIDTFALINISGIDKNKQNSLTVNTQFYKYTQLDNESNMQLRVEEYKDRLSNLLDEVIGITKTPINTQRTVVRQKESAFGNLITDALKDYTDADIAILNGGSIRGENIYVANQYISRRDIISELPYRSHIVVLPLSGIQLRQAIEHGLSGVENALGRYLQVSGLTVHYNNNRPIGKKVLSIKHDGEELLPNNIYKVAMSDYLASGGDDFTMWKGIQTFEYSGQKNMLISDVIINYIRQRSNISPTIEHRLNDLTNQGN